MPIHVYRCANNCGTEVEKLTKMASTPVPAEMIHQCKNCGAKTRFRRIIAAPAIRTPATGKSARQNDYRHKNPNWKENVISGRGAAGQRLTDRQKRSQEQWGSAFADVHGKDINTVKNE